ncbi:hypothetical protein D3C76_681860 [compost metagenome]
MDVRNDHVHARLHDADRAAGEDHALVVQAAHQHLNAAVQFAEDVLFRHFDVVEEQLAGVRAAHAQLVELVAAAETFPVALDDERGDAVRALFRLGLGVDHVGVGVGTVGDPGLAAVEHVAVALLLGAQLHGDDVGAGVRLAHRQRADVLAADQPGQVFGFLLLGAVALDLVDAEVGVRTVGQRHRSRTAADLFHGDHVRQVAQRRAAEFLFHGDAEQAHVTELLPHVHGEGVFRVDLRGARRQLGGDEAADLVAQHVDGFAEAEVEGRIAHWVHLLSCIRGSGSDGCFLVGFGHGRQAAFLGRVQFQLHLLDVQELLVQLGAACGNLLHEGFQLLVVAAAGVVEIDQFLALGQREADALAAQDQLQRDQVLRAVDAFLAAAFGAEHALFLVEADGAGGDIQFAGQVGDAVGDGHWLARLFTFTLT